MRAINYRILTSLCCLLATVPISSAAPIDSLHAFILTDEPYGNSVSLTQYSAVLADLNGEYNLEQIKALPEQAWNEGVDDITKEGPYYVWLKLRVQNAGTEVRTEFFSFCNMVDTVWMYEFKADALINEQFSGGGVRPWRKLIPSEFNYILLTIEPGDVKEYFFRLRFELPLEKGHLDEIFLEDSNKLVHVIIGNYAWQSFYAGIIALFCIVSFVMYWLFREKVFIYFAFLMFFFALYFSYMNGLLEAFFPNPLKNTRVSLGFVIISGLIMSCTYFLSRQIKLMDKMPLYYWNYYGYSLFTALVSHVLYYFYLEDYFILYFYNGVIIVWILMSVIPVFVLARRDKMSVGLLVSIGFLSVTGLIYVASFQNVYNENLFTLHSFQVGTILFSGLIFYNLIDKVNRMKVEKKRIEDIDEVKSRFFVNITHDFRTPLSLMMGPLQKLKEKVRDNESQALISMAYDNSNRLLNLINQLLDLSKLDSGKIQLEAELADLSSYVKGIAHAFENIALEKGVQLEVDCPSQITEMYFDKDKIHKVLFNLISNAVKFTGKGGKVLVAVKPGSKHVEIVVQDTGIGISRHKVSRIFDRFFQASIKESNQEEGYGIGLAIVRELVELHKGHVRVSSQEGKGTRFTITLLKGSAHLKDDEIVEPIAADISATDHIELEEYNIVTGQSVENEPIQVESREGGPTVLIVEDNADVRSFIKIQLGGDYVVKEASNGQQGLERAYEMMPELIISDVMMPQMNGLELVQKLKNDVRTSHIPVILLTAKAAPDEKLEGLSIGADDYLLKPFDGKELRVRVNNLIESRKRLREIYGSEPAILPKDMKLGELDRNFIESAIEAIKENMSDEKFGVEELSRIVGMSKPSLNRKLRAILNKSSNQFIQSVRLEAGASLLEDNILTVSEIASHTGFSSPAYFIKCFRDQYGVTPGNYHKVKKPHSNA